MSKLWDELNRPLEGDEFVKVVPRVLFCMFCVLGIICGILGVYNRTINKAQAVNEVHQDLVDEHNYNYCPWCGEKIKECE